MTNTSATGGFLQPIATTLIEDDALDAILQGWVIGITGLDPKYVRPREQLVPLPQPEATVNWCAIGVIGEPSEPWDSSAHYTSSPSTADPPDPTGDGFTMSWEQRELEVMTSFYGPARRYYTTLLRTGANVPQNREWFANGVIGQGLFAGQHVGTMLGGFSAMQIKKMPGRLIPAGELVNQQWVRRADTTMTFGLRIASTWPIENVQQVQINPTAENSSESVVSPLSVYPLVPPP